MLSHGWKGTDGRNGHIVSATKQNGEIKLFDPQNGKNYTGDGVTEYLGRVRATWNNGRETKGRLGLTRIDNMQLVPSVADAVLKGAGQ